ncbi:MAG TPA: hypothetical protein VLV30_07245 [Methanomicrobiales archaeon]|nr:hypothetical protein [Methanomicrobiales archaeon]
MERGVQGSGLINRVDLSLVVVLALVFVVPCSLGLLGGFPVHEVLGFVVTILVLQGLAAAAGVGLRIPEVLLVPLLASVAAGVILGIFRICDLFSERSSRVGRQIGRVKLLMERHPALSTYGDFMLIPIMWIPGFGLYGTPVVAWILHWRGPRSVLLMLAGWLIACLFVLGMAEGFRAVLRI